MNKKLIVVVGAGPGVGNHVAKKFGDNNFRDVLVSRNQEAEKNWDLYEKREEHEIVYS
jgi:short-subunit dehydrogenase